MHAHIPKLCKKNNQITYTYNCTFALTHPSLLSTNNQNILLVCVLWDQRKTFNGNKSEKKTINKNVNKAFLMFARFFRMVHKVTRFCSNTRP